VLGRFYQRLGRALPRAVKVQAETLTEPYRSLLAHNRDMTATLEQFHGARIALRVLTRQQEGSLYLREVVLCETKRARPVEYGMIAVHLDHFSDRGRALILAEQHPFGRILQMEAMAYIGWPQAFFRVSADPRMAASLEVKPLAECHGRRNVLLDEHRRLLAEVIEILPPAGGVAIKTHEPSSPNPAL
jgi:chorismate-pyruvate lyase